MKTKGIVIGASLAVICIIMFLPVLPPVFNVIMYPPVEVSQNEYSGSAIYDLLDNYFSYLRSDADFMVHAGREYHRIKNLNERPEIGWPVASLTKQFTGYLVARLVYEKKISWDDRLLERVHQFNKKEIGQCTIDQLSRHSSCIDSPDISSYWRMTFFDREDHSAEFIDHGLRFCFKTRGHSPYSDYNYTLLRLIIDSIETYDDIFSREIHYGLGLKNTKLELRNGTSPVNIRGYYCLSTIAARACPVKVPMPAWNISMLKGSVGVSATVNDLYEWYRHLREVYLHDINFSNCYFPIEAGSYRNGWIKTVTKDSTALFHHGGLVPGFSSFIIMDFERDLFVVYLSAISVWKSNYNIDEEIINIIKGYSYRAIMPD